MGFEACDCALLEEHKGGKGVCLLCDRRVAISSSNCCPTRSSGMIKESGSRIPIEGLINDINEMPLRWNCFFWCCCRVERILNLNTRRRLSPAPPHVSAVGEVNR